MHLPINKPKSSCKKDRTGTDHTKAPCWEKKNGSYHFRVSTKWREMLKPYKITKRGQWKEKILEVAK